MTYRSMSEEEAEEYCKRARAYTDSIVAQGSEACRRLLQDAGIIDEDGNLAEPYRGVEEK